MSKVVVNFSLDPETAEMLDKMSKERKIPKSEIIREMLKRENTSDTIDKIELKKKIDELIKSMNDPDEIWTHPYTAFLAFNLVLLMDADVAKHVVKSKEWFKSMVIENAHVWFDDVEPEYIKPDDIDAFGDKAFVEIMKCVKIKLHIKE